MKYITLLFFFIAGICRGQDLETTDHIAISDQCAAVLLVSGSAIGAGLAYAITPVALCSAGFCSVGVTGSSFAAWWQSTLPLIVKGGFFAKLQAVAMAGAGAKVTVTAAAVGGAVSATYLKDVCAFIDEADPKSKMGLASAASLSTVTAAIQVKNGIQSQCASSASCTAASAAGAATVEYVSSTWDHFTQSASNFVSDTYLNFKISSLKKEIETLTDKLGEHAGERKIGILSRLRSEIFEKGEARESLLRKKGPLTKAEDSQVEYDIRKLTKKIETLTDKLDEYAGEREIGILSRLRSEIFEKNEALSIAYLDIKIRALTKDIEILKGKLGGNSLVALTGEREYKDLRILRRVIVERVEALESVLREKEKALTMGTEELS